MGNNFVKNPYRLSANLMEINANHVNIYRWNTVISWSDSFCCDTWFILWETSPNNLHSGDEPSRRTETEEAWLNVLEVNISLQVHIIIATH